MRHSDPEVVAMLAMGETDMPAADVEHVHECAECEAELASLRRVADLARSGGPDDALGAPRPEVWTRISEQLGLRPGLVPESTPDAAAPTRGPVASPLVGSPPLVESGAPRPGKPVESETPPARRHRARAGRSRRRVLLSLAAAAVAVAVALTVTAVLIRPAAGVVLASATLDALPAGSDRSGQVTVAQHADGTRDLVVRVDGAASGSGYREVWLGSPELDRLISLGTLPDDEGTFALPAGVDLSDYPVVDVSIEPIDGDPSHSGDSILRGTLGA